MSVDILHATRRVAPQAKGGVCAPADIGHLLTRSSVVMLDGVPAVIYLRLEEDLEAFRGALRRLRYINDYRTAGLKTNSRTVGYLPRVTLRRDFCTLASAAHEHPAEHQAVVDAGRLAARHYAQHHPHGYADHVQRSLRIRPDWTISGTPFTSGTVNLSNAVRYHHDRGNIDKAWSAMIAMRRHTEGGHLAVPELLIDGRPVGLEIADKSLSIFDGQGLLHGVTPIQKTRPDAYRYTVVYYTLKQMWHCLTPEEELQRIRQKRTEREHKRAQGGHDPRVKKP